MTETQDSQNSRNGEKPDAGEKWPELERVERHLKSLEERNASLQEALSYTRSAGFLWRIGAAASFFGAVLSWWIIGKITSSAGLAALGCALLAVALVKQKISKRKKDK